VSDEFDYEPIPGLPHALPPGESILWQGRPRWQGLARHTFQVRWLAAYFAVFIVARGVLSLQDGQGLGRALFASAVVLPLAALCLGLLSLLAWLNARATVYTITTRRVVMRFGVAFPMTFNLPFKRLAAANLKTQKNGDGDIAMQLSGPDRIAWLHLWPHARPYYLAKAQPMLRAIPDAAKVSALLGEAVQAWSATDGAPVLIAASESAAEVGTLAALEKSVPARIGSTLATEAVR
jgi:hypothetical protein